MSILSTTIVILGVLMLLLVFVLGVVGASGDNEGMMFLDASLAGIGVVIAGMALKPK
jgi:hypothetical protein